METRALAVRYLNGEANEQEVMALDAWVRQSPANALLLAECAIDEQNLPAAAKDVLDEIEAREREQQITPDMLAALLPKGELEPVDITKTVLAQQSERALATQREKERREARKREAAGAKPPHVIIVPRPVVWLATAAMLGLIAWLGNSVFTGSDTPDTAAVEPAALPQQVAEVRSGSHAVWADPTISTDGLRIGEEVELLSGVAEVRFNQGAVVLVQGPAVITPTSNNALKLYTGKLIAEVPPSAVGFEVDTRFGLIRDYGTEFGVEVDAMAGLHTQVFQGEVGVMPRDAKNRLGPETKLLVNEAAEVLPGDAVVNSEAPVASRYVRREEYKLLTADDLTAADRFRAYLYELDRSANMIANISFLGGEMKVKQGPAGQAFKAEWVGGTIVPIRGNAQGTEVMRLEGVPDQGIDIVMPTEQGMDKLTFIAWARVEPQLNRTNAPLLHHNRVDMPKSTPNWQLRPDLDQIHVNQFSEQGKTTTRRSASASVDGIVWEQWHCYAVVIDVRTGKCEHYLDGRWVGSAELGQKVPIKLDGLRIASTGREVTRHPRTIKGEIGLFTFLNTTLDDEGIRRMYEESRGLFD
ncbi:MAG: FecR family protein [Phycisphaeraceae bacterium]|nr:FecR family protein [Phycisphaeraceae bacterium]